MPYRRDGDVQKTGKIGVSEVHKHLTGINALFFKIIAYVLSYWILRRYF
jgi:hypothetical protein